jgi:hypothetical protein
MTCPKITRSQLGFAKDGEILHGALIFGSINQGKKTEEMLF